MELKDWKITSTYVTDKDIQRLIELAENGIKRSFTKEEALESLVRAGILDKNGNYTSHYPELAKWAERQLSMPCTIADPI